MKKEEAFEARPNESQEDYVKRSFMDKVKGVASKVPFVPDAISMYYAMLDPTTPVMAKATIVAALAYFIMPVDAIPDFIAIAGFTDDAGAIAAALAAVNNFITSEHKSQALALLNGN